MNPLLQIQGQRLKQDKSWTTTNKASLAEHNSVVNSWILSKASRSNKIFQRLLEEHSWLPQNSGFCNHGGDNIWIHVRSRSPVLKVTLSFFLCVSSNTDWCPTVSNTLKNDSIRGEIKHIDCSVFNKKTLHKLQSNSQYKLNHSTNDLYPFESVDVSCFMFASESAFIAFTICGNVLTVPQSKFLNCFLNNLKASIVPHRLGAAALSNISWGHRNFIPVIQLTQREQRSNL